MWRRIDYRKEQGESRELRGPVAQSRQEMTLLDGSKDGLSSAHVCDVLDGRTNHLPGETVWGMLCV